MSNDLEQALKSFYETYNANYVSSDAISALQKTFQSHNITIEDWNSILEFLKSENNTTDSFVTFLNNLMSEIETIETNQTSMISAIGDKVSKSSEHFKVYGTDYAGNQITIPYSTDTDALSIAMRTGDGNIVIPLQPQTNNEAASKKYVDDLIANRISNWAFAYPYVSGHNYSIGDYVIYGTLIYKKIANGNAVPTDANVWENVMITNVLKILENDVKTLATRVYKFQGSKRVAELNDSTFINSVTGSMNGYVYDILDSGTLNDNKGGHVSVSYGDNVAIVWAGGVFSWDKLAATVDMSNYYTKSEVYAKSETYSKSESDTLLNGKVNTSSTGRVVYGTSALGGQTTISYSGSEQTPNALVMRDSDSQIRLPLVPTLNVHAASKKYVDDSISSAISTSYVIQAKKTVAELNALTLTPSMNGNVYAVTDSGTLTNGELQVSAGDKVRLVYTSYLDRYTWYKLSDVITVDLTNYYTKSETNTLVNTAVGGLSTDIQAIESLIPAQATSSNQLADKEFVNSSIATQTSNFLGTFNLVTDLGLTASATHSEIATAIATKLASLSITPTSNDYVFVGYPNATVSTQYDQFDRYKYNNSTSSWEYEYTLNNSSFTAEQWASINSGITAQMVSNMALKSANNIFTGENQLPIGTKIYIPNTNYYYEFTNENFGQIGFKRNGQYGIVLDGNTVRGVSELHMTSSKTIGATNNRVNKFYTVDIDFSGVFNPNASGYGYTLPDSSGLTANKELATTDKLEVVSITLSSTISDFTQEMLDILNANKILKVNGTVSVFVNGVFLKTGGIGTDIMGVCVSSQQVRAFRIRSNGSVNSAIYLELPNLSRINANSSQKGLIPPPTTGWTDDKTLATTDQAFNVINASDIVNNTLTQAQYDLFTNGKPTLIKGTLLNFVDPIILNLKQVSSTKRGLIIGGMGTLIPARLAVIVINDSSLSIALSGSSRYIEFSDENDKININVLGLVNGKAVPAYPSSPANNKVLTYTTSNALSWEDPAGGSSVTLNGSASASPSFYAPTTGGTGGEVLVANGSGNAPTWESRIYDYSSTTLATLDATAWGNLKANHYVDISSVATISGFVAKPFIGVKLSINGTNQYVSLTKNTSAGKYSGLFFIEESTHLYEISVYYVSGSTPKLVLRCATVY